ncbi:CBP80/20-dependent translation initiation factor isoform X1 [Cuculus canorus]|uniref:CBP80/20-dependent translation initiation factor isoform X1 n=1 Tax=Cuculus canorus TaxID=55661 RepID=UPI0023AA3788|nr:CBP80/20-dependent translation initiation factor isoform X1 [Cuculus canorus]XP_053909504.1 CBP80/20-dependent translation initiation factor isoform X1 [Cuculus canorus]XP_053909508.1 CBP80/20-dependent translation initiation factor isoform X1 [Cuculus canorus]
MENSSVASASSEAGSSRSQEIEELERFIDSYVLEYQVQGLLTDKTEGDGESEKTQSHISQWTADCSEQLDGSCSPSQGKGSSSHEHNQEEWDHSSSGSTGSRPGSGSRRGSGSRSGSHGRSSQFRQSTKNGNKESSLDMLGTDIWAANTFDSFSGATWDLQPEKLDFTQFHRKLRNTSKHPLPHIDREGLGKGKYEDGDSINLNDIEKVLPVWQGYHQLPHEAEIAHTKKLFRRRRNDRRRQQRLPSGNKSQQHTDHQQGGTKHNRDHQKLYQGGQAPHSSGRTGHHGYSQNRRWHHNQKHSPNDKETHRNAKETENLKIEDNSVCTVHIPAETHRSPEAVEKQSQQYIQESETKRKDSIHERIGERPKINLLQSSKDRLRRRLKEKMPCLSLFTDQDEVTVENTNPEKNKMDKLIEILNSMRNNSSDVDSKLTTFMEEAQNSTNSEEMLGEIVKTIYQKAVTDRSFASTAAKLCDKMALFMVEGTKFRSLLLNMLQKDFTMREELQQRDVERWLGFITFLCEVFGTMRSSTGEPFRVLVCPIYTCLRELLQSQDVKEDAVLCCSMELQSTGRLLEEQLPEMMTELLAIARDKMLCPSESMLTRSLLLEVIELHANNWNPLTPTITQYYNKTIQKLTA